MSVQSDTEQRIAVNLTQRGCSLNHDKKWGPGKLGLSLCVPPVGHLSQFIAKSWLTSLPHYISSFIETQINILNPHFLCIMQNVAVEENERRRELFLWLRKRLTKYNHICIFKMSICNQILKDSAIHKIIEVLGENKFS